MNATWYERQGPARDVLITGTMPDPEPAAGEVRIRLHASGINPGDLIKRKNAFGVGMPYPRIIPHSDGAGVIDKVGAGVPVSRVGERVWCFGAQSDRAFGTAAEFTVVPAPQAIALPANTSFDEGACLGIPGITAHRAVHAGGPVAGQCVLVHGGGGGVGAFAVGLARQAGAAVIATVRSDAAAEAATKAGAHHVIRTDGKTPADIIAAVRQAAPAEGVHHIVDVAFDANIDVNTEVIALGGSISAYATKNARPEIPFWNLLFKNVRIHLLGSDDFEPAAKQAAAKAVNELLESGWTGVSVDRSFALAEIVAAHEYAESKPGAGRVVLKVA